jgi:hypothetical protein
MNKIIVFLVILVIIAIGAVLLMNVNKPSVPAPSETSILPQTSEEGRPASKLDPGNAKYFVEAQLVELLGGKAESISPYGAAKQTTELWGTPISSDFNTDGQPDWAVILTQKTENDPGVYYYAAVALVDETKNLIVGSNAVPIGDRIDIKNVAVVNDALKIDYLDWKTTGDEVEKTPTVAASKSFILDGVMFRELTDKRANAQIEAACTDKGGTWDKTAVTCAGLTKEWCDKTGGTFSNGTCKF